MADNILIVEDSPVVLKMLQHLIAQSGSFNPVVADTLSTAKMRMEECGGQFFAAIVDLKLPDAQHGEIVDLVLGQRIPTVVLTGNYDDKLRLSLLNKGVVDYVTKDSRYSFQHVVKLIDRLKKNENIKVLVAEDSATSRLFVKVLLEQYRFQVVEASNGQEALARLEADQSIRMLITDHNMPVVNGYELVRMLRHSSRFQDLVIIGLSAEGDTSLSAKFIKSGANDFLKKPFFHEEFHCRVIHNLEAQEMLETIRELANVDPLTKVYNRRYLFEEGEARYQRALSADRLCHVIMVDLDYFKKVNDMHGHLIGDQLLESFAALLTEYFPDALVARFGGEEFCVLDTQSSKERVTQRMNGFRALLSKETFTKDNISVTFSGGVASESLGSLEEAVMLADKRLIEAKRAGRNRVFFSPASAVKLD